MPTKITPHITIRPLKPTDWPEILRVHRDAIMGKTSKHYTRKQREAWSQSMVSDLEQRKESVTKGDIIAFVAEFEKRIIGFATAAPSRNQLFQLYVAPGEQKGAGKKLLSEIEEKTAQSGAKYLEGRSTVNAVEFYRRNNYEIGEQGVRELPSGITIQGFAIRKQLKPRT